MSTNVKNNQEKKNIILEVKDLRISFRTNEGVVKAVRGVSYDLEEGETLAIVGESGSGKSVSSRSIMGILAGNAIIDGGSIIYEGQDLLKLHEDEFHKIRGNKIGMIFQDPTSSLNPIMRVGKQIEEGMLVNGKRKKNKYRDLIQKEHQDYVNAKYDLHDYKTNYNFKKKQKDDIRRYKLEIKQINANQSISRAQKDELIAENRVIIEQIRTRQPILTAEERKEKLVEVKQRLKTTKSELKVVKAKAKLEIREEYKQYKEEYKAEVESIRNQVVTGKWTSKLKFFLAVTFLPLLKFFKFNFSFKNEYQALSDAYEAWQRKIKVTRLEAREEALDIMREVGIAEPEKRINMYPFQFSGGMKQRIVIAIALTADPEILICDEPTTALDVTIQAQILELLKKLKKERGLTLIFITHNLGVVANMADRVAVMYAGKIVEFGRVDEIFFNPKHPYTWALLSSMPDLNSDDRLITIPGTPPNMLYPPKGDAFAIRNAYALKIDFEEMPPMFKVSDTHYAATWLLHEKAPKISMPSLISKRIEAMNLKIKQIKQERQEN
jgi:oligopeptide transport system ATP-binding protein